MNKNNPKILKSIYEEETNNFTSTRKHDIIKNEEKPTINSYTLIDSAKKLSASNKNNSLYDNNYISSSQAGGNNIHVNIRGAWGNTYRLNNGI